MFSLIDTWGGEGRGSRYTVYSYKEQRTGNISYDKLMEQRREIYNVEVRGLDVDVKLGDGKYTILGKDTYGKEDRYILTDGRSVYIDNKRGLQDLKG